MEQALDSFWNWMDAPGALNLFSWIGGAVFLAFAAEAWLRGRVWFGLMTPRITRADQPKAFYAIIVGFLVVAAWSLLAGAMAVG